MAVIASAQWEREYEADLATARGSREKLGTCKCMRWIKKHYAGKRIGLPKIGAGLAGGDWGLISAIIDEELAGENVTLVEFRP